MSSAGGNATRDRGSSAVEFSMIAVLLSSIFFVVLQAGIYLYQRSVVASGAMAGARYAANANVSSSAGGPRASEVIAQSLSVSAAQGLTCTATEKAGQGGLQLVVVNCTGSLPSMASVLGANIPVNVSASVIKEGQ